MTYIEDTLRDLQARLARVENKLARKSATEVPSVEPTYVGSTGSVHLLSVMPTRYLRNVEALSDYRMTVGLREAIAAELRRRAKAGEGDAA